MMKTISTNELLFLYKNNSVLILDVRSKFEFSRRHIPNSYNIPFEVLTKQCSNYLNKNLTYYVICSKGENSKAACLDLESKGYNVINVGNGFNNWKGPIASSRMIN